MSADQAVMFCRIPSDDYPCAMGLMVDEHKLLNGRWVHPELDERGRYVWPEGSL